MKNMLDHNLIVGVLLCVLCHLSGLGLCFGQNASNKLPKYTIEYIGDSIQVLNASAKMNGFWIYLPTEELPPVDNVVVFMHGYGAFNPLLFGAWLRHLVEEGNIVIYPRYQKTLWVPKPRKFLNNTLTGIKDALQLLKDQGWDENLWSELDLVGHSYGGVISMNLAENQEAYKIPAINNVMICSAGSGPFKAGLLDTYDRVDANLIMVTSQYDTTVGSKFTKRVERLTPEKKNKIHLHQSSFKEKEYKITSHHNEPYALDFSFDNGIRNFTVKKAFNVSRTNEIDLGGYWVLFDRLIEEGDGFIQTIRSQNEWALSEKYPTLKLTVKQPQ